MSLSVLPVSKECKEGVRKELNLDEHGIEQALNGLKYWLKQQPHLPDEEDERILERWLLRCKNSVEKTKKTLDMYFTLRTEYPEIMCGWDTSEPWFDCICQYGYIIALPQLTPDLDRVIMFGYHPKDLGEDYQVYSSIKLMLICTEIRLLMDYNLRDVYIMDMNNITFEHIKHITLSVVKKLETCFLSGYKARMKAVHFINTPPYAEILVNIVKSVLKSKLVSRVYVHGSDLTELHNHVPKSVLPVEMGGECGTMEEHWDIWKAEMRKKSSYLQEREKKKSDESKRVGRKEIGLTGHGTEGSFRTLNID